MEKGHFCLLEPNSLGSRELPVSPCSPPWTWSFLFLKKSCSSSSRGSPYPVPEQGGGMHCSTLACHGPSDGSYCSRTPCPVGRVLVGYSLRLLLPNASPSPFLPNEVDIYIVSQLFQHPLPLLLLLPSHSFSSFSFSSSPSSSFLSLYVSSWSL